MEDLDALEPAVSGHGEQDPEDQPGRHGEGDELQRDDQPVAELVAAEDVGVLLDADVALSRAGLVLLEEAQVDDATDRVEEERGEDDRRRQQEQTGEPRLPKLPAHQFIRSVVAASKRWTVSGLADRVISSPGREPSPPSSVSRTMAEVSPMSQ